MSPLYSQFNGLIYQKFTIANYFVANRVCISLTGGSAERTARLVQDLHRAARFMRKIVES